MRVAHRSHQVGWCDKLFFSVYVWESLRPGINNRDKPKRQYNWWALEINCSCQNRRGSYWKWTNGLTAYKTENWCACKTNIKYRNCERFWRIFVNIDWKNRTRQLSLSSKLDRSYSGRLCLWVISVIADQVASVSSEQNEKQIDLDISSSRLSLILSLRRDISPCSKFFPKCWNSVSKFSWLLYLALNLEIGAHSSPTSARPLYDRHHHARNLCTRSLILSHTLNIFRLVHVHRSQWLESSRATFLSQEKIHLLCQIFQCSLEHMSQGKNHFEKRYLMREKVCSFCTILGVNEV